MRSAFALTPQGLLVQEGESQQKAGCSNVHEAKGDRLHVKTSPLRDHPGVHRTIELVKQRYWWKGMGKDIKDYVKSCPVYEVMKSDDRKKAGPL